MVIAFFIIHMCDNWCKMTQYPIVLENRIRKKPGYSNMI